MPQERELTTEERRIIKEKIIRDLNSVAREITELEILTRPIAPECALGDLARFELMNDQRISEKTLAEALQRKKRLKYALRKVDTAQYGICLECEEEISFDRLLILPESTHCIACASDLE